MPRTCTICAHEAKVKIDRALVASEPLRTIADHWSVSKTSLMRHKAEHVPATLAKAQEAQEMARADDLLAGVRDLQARTLAILEAAEEVSQHRTALAAIREARSNLELLAKLLGELDDRPEVNLVLSPEWLELRAVVVGALEPHPDAQGAVLRALGGAGHGRA